METRSAACRAVCCRRITQVRHVVSSQVAVHLCSKLIVTATRTERICYEAPILSCCLECQGYILSLSLKSESTSSSHGIAEFQKNVRCWYRMESKAAGNVSMLHSICFLLQSLWIRSPWISLIACATGYLDTAAATCILADAQDDDLSLPRVYGAFRDNFVVYALLRNYK